jgi:hypothetical protein
MAKRHANWRGCKDIDMVYYNDWADPDLVATIDGQEYVFNYWDIEDALWDTFLEVNDISDSEARGPEWEDKFDKFCQSEAYSYLEDCLYGGYFAEGSYSWHDKD